MTHSIIQKSQLEGAQRIDAEYYQPENLRAATVLKNAKKISKLTSDIRYGLYVEPDYLQSGTKFVRALNLLDFWIDGEILKIDSTIASSTYLLEKGDCLIVRSGANTGKVVIVNEEFINSTFGSYIIRIRFNKINPYFAALFLNSKYGIIQTLKFQTGMAQPNLNVPNIKEIKIPIIDDLFQKEIEKEILNVENRKINSAQCYQQAEDLLLEELGLKDFNEENDLFSIVNFSEIQKYNRIDAEYFQVKYQKLIEKISSQNFKKLDDLVSITKGFEPGSEAYQGDGKLFIRVSNLTKLGINEGNQQYLSEDLYNKLKPNFEPKVGEILLTKDASPGIAYVMKERIEGIISSGILRLKVKNEIESEYLSLVISSLVGKMQAERDAGGSIIAHWKPEQIKNILIPILPLPIQQKISDLVRTSHIARQKSKELLDEAKRKVEEMIEKGGE